MSAPVLPSSPTTAHPDAAPPPPAPRLLDRTFLTNIAGVTQVALVRHGQQVSGGRERVDRRQPDPPLSATGREQAALVGAAFADEPLAAVYCSTLRRAAETALAIATPHGLEPVVCEELREIELFRHVPEGQTITDVASKLLLRGANHRFAAERRWEVFPYSETGGELRARVVTIVEGILAAHRGAKVAVVCHGGVVNAYLAHVLMLGEDMFFHPAHASVSRVLAREERRVLHSLNETHHFGRGSGDPLVTY